MTVRSPEVGARPDRPTTPPPDYVPTVGPPLRSRPTLGEPSASAGSVARPPRGGGPALSEDELFAAHGIRIPRDR